jgi:predicted house-cleaning noncanonical NTP pyrophosphatase (MazG superfamily)
MSFGESYMGAEIEEKNNLETSGAFFMDDGMDALPDVVEVATIEDIINQTGLSPDALEQYRVEHTAQ